MEVPYGLSTADLEIGSTADFWEALSAAQQVAAPELGRIVVQAEPGDGYSWRDAMNVTF